MGIKVKPELDLAAMLAFKDAGVKGNVDGVAFLLRKHKIDHFHGTGRILSPGKVEVTFINGEKQVVESKAIVIATGSEVAALPGIAIDEETVISSTGALSLNKVPKRMVVIGGGYIGLELGSVWSRLGAAVTVVEMLPRLAPGLDAEVAKALQRVLEKQGIAFKLGTKVVKADSKGRNVKLTLEPAEGGKSETLECDVVLVAVGRIPNTQRPRPRRARHQVRQPRTYCRRRTIRDECPRHLRHRRCHQRAHARPQGRGGGNRRRRDPRRPGGSRELRA